MITDTIRFLVVHSKELDFREYGNVIESPVKKVTCSSKKFENVSEAFLFIEEYLGHAFILVDAFEKPEYFSGFFGGL